MSSSRLEEFRRIWTDKGTLTANEHWEERLYYMREADRKKQRAREDAQTQLEDLRNRDAPLASFDDEARKIKGNLDTNLKSIEKASNKTIRGIEEIQRKEMADHEKAYHEALAARPFMNDILPNHSTTTVVATIDHKTALNSGDTASASQILESLSPGSPPHDSMLPTQDAIPTITAPGEHDESAVPAKQFSCTVQPLQEIAELRDNQSLPVNSSVNPLPTPDNEQGASRTITFDEVYQNGQAKHKDTIVEFPPDSGRWYIVKCEEHTIRFGLRPLQGAAKHLNGRLHGGLDRSWALATEMLGYRVIDCTKELAALNNEVVNNAFAHGYKPENEVKRKQHPEIPENASHRTGATTISRKRSGTSQTSIGCKSTSSPSRKRRKEDWSNPTDIITNPKTFHVYYCFWKDHHCLYPVMILAWDNQEPGGLEHDLVSTGLLDKNSNPPNCYIYKDTDSGKNKAIAGWAPGFEDGGSKVQQRKFPAMFFDPDKGVSWVSANLLSKFPLFEPDPPKKRSHPFNVARRWVAKNKGFASWEEFEEAQKEKGREKRERWVSTPSVSPLSEINDAENGSDTESSAKSYTSNVTEKVLQEMRDRAGEITGDSDYAGSDADSTLDDEHKEWEQVETDGRPWAWYVLRKKSHTDLGKTESSISTPDNNPVNNKVEFSVREGTETARRLSIHACTQDEDYSVKEGPNAKASDPPRRTVENPAQDGDNQSSRGTPVTNLYTANAVNQATPPLTGPILRDITKTDDHSEPKHSPPPPVAPVFKPKEPLGPAVFELSSYSKGSISWNRENEETSLRLYYGEGDRVVGTVDAPVNIVIDPTTLGGITREEIPESRGNVAMTLFGKDPSDASVKVVFDRPMGSKADIGKVQSRKFLRWIRSVVPTLPLLEG